VVTTVDREAIAAGAQWNRKYDPAIIGRLPDNMPRIREIISKVHLLIDLVPLVDVTPRGRNGRYRS
jgi:hypothetical protein